MQYLSRAETEELKTRRLTEPFVDDTLRELDRILSSQKFERVQQRAKDFLGFVVTKKLLGHSDAIKETMIAVAVYGEPAGYDTAVNRKVSVAGCDLRQRLQEYNAGEGQNDPIHIQIPLGAYVPEIIERRPAVTVSLFDNWNPAGDQSHLCDTVRDEIIDRLKHAENVRASRIATSTQDSQRFHYVLRGSLECRNGFLRLNISLADHTGGQVVLSEAFEGKRDDLLSLCRKIAEAVVATVKPQANGSQQARCSESPERFEALQLYQQARLHLQRRTVADIREAIELFERTVEANAEFARAYAGLADCHLVLSWYEMSAPDREWFETAKKYALKGFDLNPRLPEVRTSLGYAKILCDFDWVGAEEEFRHAILFDNRYAPAHHWYANLLVMQGRFAEAEEETKRAFHIDSRSIVIRKTLGDPHYYSRHYERAIDAYRATLAIDPNFWMAHMFLGWAYEQAGDMARAHQEFEAVTARACIGSVLQGSFGHLYAISGREEEARAILRSLQERANVAPHTMAVIYAGLGEKDLAFNWLEACYQGRIELVAWIKVDPRFAALRDDPRFDQFLERLGLTPAKRAASA